MNYIEANESSRLTKCGEVVIRVFKHRYLSFNICIYFILRTYVYKMLIDDFIF